MVAEIWRNDVGTYARFFRRNVWENHGFLPPPWFWGDLIFQNTIFYGGTLIFERKLGGPYAFAWPKYPILGWLTYIHNLNIIFTSSVTLTHWNCDEEVQIYQSLDWIPLEWILESWSFKIFFNHGEGNYNEISVIESHSGASSKVSIQNFHQPWWR